MFHEGLQNQPDMRYAVSTCSSTVLILDITVKTSCSENANVAYSSCWHFYSVLLQLICFSL